VREFVIATEFKNLLFACRHSGKDQIKFALQRLLVQFRLNAHLDTNLLHSRQMLLLDLRIPQPGEASEFHRTNQITGDIGYFLASTFLEKRDEHFLYEVLRKAFITRDLVADAAQQPPVLLVYIRKGDPLSVLNKVKAFAVVHY